MSTQSFIVCCVLMHCGSIVEIPSPLTLTLTPTPRCTQYFIPGPVWCSGKCQWHKPRLGTSWQVLPGFESRYGTRFSITRSNPDPDPNPNPNPNLHILCQCQKSIKEGPQSRIIWRHDCILLAISKKCQRSDHGSNGVKDGDWCAGFHWL